MDAYRGESKLAFLLTVTRRLAYNDVRDRHARKREGTHVATGPSCSISPCRATSTEQVTARTSFSSMAAL